MQAEKRARTITRVAVMTIVVNLMLTAFMLTAGLIAGSYAVVSDAANSASDVLTSLVVIIGVRAASKKADRGHPYGHERLECVASIILAVFLFAVAVGIGFAGAKGIISGEHQNREAPGVLALVAAITSIAVKEGLFWVTRHYAVTLQSGVLKADAWHHRSDSLSSLGSFIGVLGARLGLQILDPIASFVICIFIVKAAASVFIDAVKKLTDESADEKTVERLREVILSVEHVIGIDELKTRKFGDRLYVETTVAMPESLSFLEAHDVTDHVHDCLECSFPEIKHCYVHAHPGLSCRGDHDPFTAEVPDLGNE